MRLNLNKKIYRYTFESCVDIRSEGIKSRDVYPIGGVSGEGSPPWLHLEQSPKMRKEW